MLPWIPDLRYRLSGKRFYESGNLWVGISCFVIKITPVKKNRIVIRFLNIPTIVAARALLLYVITDAHKSRSQNIGLMRKVLDGPDLTRNN